MHQGGATGEACRRSGGRARGAVAAVAAGALVLVLLLAVPLAVSACTQEAATSTSALPASTSTTVAVSSSTTATSDAATSTTVTSGPGEETTSTTALPGVVKVGALFPLTGDLAAEGESALKGMRLAIEEINTAGGIASMGGALLTLVESDSKGDPTTAAAQVADLVQKEGVSAIVGTGQSTVALEATDAAERLQIPFIVSSGAADEITARGFGYTFRLCPKADWYARDQVAFLKTVKTADGSAIGSVALLHPEGDLGGPISESQKAHLSAAGIEVAADIEYAPDQADLHNELIAVRQRGAQAVLTATLLTDAVLIAQSAAALHLNLPIVDAAGGVLDPGFIGDAGETAALVMSVAESGPGMASGLGADQGTAQSDPVLDADMLYAYQAVYVLASALERGGSAEGPVLRGALKTTALYGKHLVIPQGLLMFDATGQNQEARLLVLQVQDGRLVTVWPQEYAQSSPQAP